MLAIAVLGAQTAFDNETKEYDSCEVNSVEGDSENYNPDRFWILVIPGCRQAESLLYSDDDVDMTSFEIPKNFDVNKVVEAITTVSLKIHQSFHTESWN